MEARRLRAAGFFREQKSSTDIATLCGVDISSVKRLQAEGVSGLEFAWLPAYAPELNPVESLWGWSKYSDLANHVPDDTPRLPAVVRRSLGKPRRRPQLKRSFFHAAKLTL
ncbi:MAG: transposase [Planctomycetaceae bacterium]|nr:transposase [Planctomycetaceae bacterium]